MKKKVIKKETPRPEGVYGGESNGSNPLEWCLRSTICAQLREAGYYAEMDRLSDGSGSWIAIYSKENNPTKSIPGKRLQVVISFNDKGSIITGIKMYEEDIYLTTSGTKSIF